MLRKYFRAVLPDTLVLPSTASLAYIKQLLQFKFIIT